MTQDASSGISWCRHIEIQQSIKFKKFTAVKQAVVTGTEIVVETSSATVQTVSVYSIENRGSLSKPNCSFTIPASTYRLLYIKQHRAFAASCQDLKLRLYSSNFEEVQCISTPDSLLCLAYEQEQDLLVAGGVGTLHSWAFQPGRNVLVQAPPFTTTMTAQQWVVAVSVSQDCRTLMAVTHEGVHIISLQARQETAYVPNGHKTGISCVLSCMGMYITAGKDGSLLIWGSRIAQPLRSIDAHGREIVSMCLHPTKPHLYTASSDGCIKVWDTQTLNEMYQFYTTEGTLMEFHLVSSSQAVCYTNKTVLVLNITMPDRLFSLLSSKVAKLSHSNHSPGRLITVCEDGGVRLVCPVSGATTNVLYPEFSNADHAFQDIVFSQEHSSLVVLLKSHEVMIFDCQVNPCCCRALCTADTPEDGVTCIAHGSVWYDGVDVELIFAGHLSGFISLLSGSSINMSSSVCGHKGSILSLYVSPSDPQLLSFSSDQYLKVWSLPLYYGDLQMTILMSVSLEREPAVSHFLLLNDTVCLGLANSGPIKMVHYCLPSNCSGTTNSLSSSKRKESLRLRELKTFSHSLSESHTGNLISLSTTRGLPVVCSLATDFFVKLWNLECMLLREVTLGLNLSGACILLNPCILALSWRSHLLVIDDILSQESVSRLASANSRSDQVMASRPGLSVSFDPSLQFWYDSTKNKHNRINPRSGSGGLFSPQHSKHTVADSAGTRQFKHTVPGVLLEENAIAEKHPSPKPTFSGGTGNLTCNVRRNNGVDSTELDASQKKLQESLKEDREDRRSPLRSAVKNSFIKQISQGLSSPSRTLDSSYETLTAQGEGYRSAETSRFFSNLDRLGKVPPFHIPESVVLKAPRFPSQDLPVAPDGFIPNSIIRARFHLRKKSDGLLRASPLPTTVGLTFNLSSFLNPRNKRRSSSFELSSLSFESTIEPADKMSEDADVSSDTNATSQFLKDFCELEWKKRNKRPSKIKPSSLEPIDLNLLTRPRLQVDLEEIDLNLSMGYLQKKSRNKNTKRKLRSHPPMLDSDSYDSDFPHSCSPTPDLSRKRASGSLSAASSGDPHPTSSHNCRSALSGKMSPQSSHSYRRLSSNLIGGRTFSGKDLSLISSRSKVQSITKMLSSTGVSSNTQVQSSCQDQSSSQVQSSAIMQSSAKMESSAKMQSSDSLNLLERIIAQEWYPKRATSNPTSAKTVIRTLTELLEEVSATSVFKKICSSVKELHHADMCTPDVYSCIEETALQQLEARSDDVQRVSLLDLITTLGLRSQALLRSIIPFLARQEDETCDGVDHVKAATFAALEELAGVTNREELANLMIELDLISSDLKSTSDMDVLQQAAARLKSRMSQHERSCDTSNSQLQVVQLFVPALHDKYKDHLTRRPHRVSACIQVENKTCFSSEGRRSKLENSTEIDNSEVSPSIDTVCSVTTSAQLLIDGNQWRRNVRTNPQTASQQLPLQHSVHQALMWHGLCSKQPLSDTAYGQHKSRHQVGGEGSHKSLPSPIRHWLVKDPSHVPEEILHHFLRGDNCKEEMRLKKKKTRCEGNKFTWSDVIPVINANEHVLPIK